MKLKTFLLVIRCFVLSSLGYSILSQASNVIVNGDTVVTGAGNHTNKYVFDSNTTVPLDLKFTAQNTVISSFEDTSDHSSQIGDRVLTFSGTTVFNGISVQRGGTELVIDSGSHITAGSRGTGVFIGGSDLGAIPTESVVARIQDSLIENNSTNTSRFHNSAVTANALSDVTIENSTLISTTGSGIYALLANSVQVTGSTINSKTAGLDIMTTDLVENPGRYYIDNSTITSSDAAAIEINSLTPSEDNQKVAVTIANNSILSGKDNQLVSMSGDVDTEVVVNNSQLTGDISIDTAEGGTAHLILENSATLTGQLTSLSSVALNSGGSWILTQDSTQSAIAMNGGSVNFGDASSGFKVLNVETLSGSGEFYMSTDVTASKGDFLNVTNRADGSYLIHVANTGKEPTLDDDGKVHLVHIADGSASFDLKNNQADIGVWQYGLERQGNDWYLETNNDNTGGGESDRETSSSTDGILSMANVTRQVFYGEMDALRAHSQVRDTWTAGEGRVWGNYLNNTVNQKGDMTSEYRLQQSGVVLGAEQDLLTPLGNAVAGVFAVNSTNSVKHDRGGKSSVDSWGLGMYGTLYLPDNYYVDATIKGNSFNNNLHARMADGDTANGGFDQFGYGVAVEGGKKFHATESVWITPYLRTTWFQTSSSSLAVDNGMQAGMSGVRSLQSEAGVRAGKDSIGVGPAAITPYVTLAGVQELITANRVDINDHDFNNDLSGTSVKTGVGLNARITKDLTVNSEAKYVKGNKVESPIMATLGLSYAF